jgi:predicted O-linked N-acetylglucosamine transferase (SPINDLY family)
LAGEAMLRRLADALIAAGRRAEESGRLQAACRRYRAAAALAPSLPAAHLNLGGALEAAGDPAAAGTAYARLLARAPDDPYANYNLGRLRYAAGDLRAAEGLLGRALQAKPDFADALIALALAQEAQGELQAAAASLERALGLRTGAAGAWYDYGDVLIKLERHEAAEAALRRVLELEPRFTPAWHLLGTLLRSEARVDEAAAAFAAAHRIEPDNYHLESLELHALHLSDQVSAAALFERHRAFGARLEAAVGAPLLPHANERSPDRRLRVGFVSSDFFWHPVTVFLIPLLERRDRDAWQVFAYYTGARPDETTARVQALVDGWLDAAPLSEAELAQRIRRDGIDVLFDLTGHAGACRLGTFARQPAPVQIAWLGYLHSTGLTRIGYRLTDARADPPGAADRLHTEQLVRLPHSQWCYRPALRMAHAEAPPSVRNGYVTFGSFNSMPKLSTSVRRWWAQILRAMPGARLLLVGITQGRARESLEREFAQAGVAPERLTILSRVPLDKYLSQYAAVDIALDSWPYGGGTTTFDSLWMGVPVLTLTGDRSASRSAASILAALGLEDWIAESPDAYVARALQHAGDAPRLAALRGALRARLQASALMDEAAFARDVQATCRRLWRDWCARSIA